MQTPIKKITIATILLLTFGLSSMPVIGQKATLTPDPYITVLNNAGQVVVGACIWTYVAGTTTPATTWSDVNQLSPNTNPVITDSAGRATIFLAPSVAYKYTIEQACTPPAHGTLIRTQDNITGVLANTATVDIVGTAGSAITAGQCAYLSDGSGGLTPGFWYPCDSANAYSSTVAEVGIAPNNIPLSTSGTIRISGEVGGLPTLTLGAPYYAGSLGAITPTTPANLRFLGRADTATSILVAANPPSPGQPCITVTSTSSGTLNNFNPGIVGPCTIIRMNNTSLATISGFIPGADGQQIIVEAINSGQVDLVHNNTSTVGQRLFNMVSSGNTSLVAASVASHATATYIYDGTSFIWRLVNHNQGYRKSWSPALFFGSGQTGITYSVLNGSAVLVGRQVIATVAIALGNKGTSTGNATIQGLPYPEDPNLAGFFGGFTVFASGMAGLTGNISASTSGSTLQLYEPSATGTIALTDANFGNATLLYITVIYQTQ